MHHKNVSSIAGSRLGPKSQFSWLICVAATTTLASMSRILLGMDESGIGRDFLTVEQAASYLHLSQSSIRSYIRTGNLKAFRIAGKRKVLIQRDDLMALLEPARPTDGLNN